MKVVAAIFSLSLAILPGASAYTLSLSDGSSGSNSVGFADFMGARHWNSFSFDWSPQSGESSSFIAGNHYSLGTMVNVVPDSAAEFGQTVQLSLLCHITESAQLSFDNYQSIPYEFGYSYELSIWADPAKSGAALGNYLITPSHSEVSLSLLAGSSVWFEFQVDPSAVELSHVGPDYLWRPTVTDPQASGHVSVDLSGALNPVSLQVVPEPSALALLGTTLGLVGMRRRRLAA